MTESPAARRDGPDVVVTDLPDLPGWAVTVHADGSATVQPAPGERLSWHTWRRLPIGSVLAAVDGLTRDGRAAALVANEPPLGLDDRRPGERRHRTVARTYRKALAAGLTPRDVVAALYGVSTQLAGAWITDARRDGVLASVQQERAALVGGAR